MSFFKELHYLFEWLEEHELTVGALSMWLVLMVFNNDCVLPTVSGEWLWRVMFSVANRRIDLHGGALCIHFFPGDG